MPMIWSDAGAGDPLSPGDVGLVGGLAGLQEGLPLDGLAEEFDHPGRPGLPGRLRVAPPARDGAHDPVGGDPARQGVPTLRLGSGQVLLFSKVPVGPSGISTVFSRYSAVVS